MGANGSGKSTFARMVAGLLEPNRGILKIQQGNDNEIPVGLIFQDPDNQMVAVLVENELAFTMENLNFPQKKMSEDVEAALNRFSIQPLRQRITSELSGGEKQKVALASVMIIQPDILILDEPDSFLDEKSKKNLKQELNSIRKDKPEMIQIHITQYPDIALEYDRMIVFCEGEIVADESPRKIFQDISFLKQTGLSFEQSESDVTISSVLQNGTDENRVAIIKLDNVSFDYSKEIKVINKISGSVKSSEIVGIVGSSGSGKSTLGQLLCQLLKPTTGDVIYYNEQYQIIDSQNLRGKISALFQQPEKQFFLSNCEQEVRFGPQNFGKILETEEVVSLFSLVGLDYKLLAKRDPLTLSGGEKRRLAFASVLSLSPDFIIFDEPTCGLDPEGVGLFIKLIQNLKKYRKGIIIISHDGYLLNKLTDKILLIDNNGSGRFFNSSLFFDNKQLSSIISPVNHLTT